MVGITELAMSVPPVRGPGSDGVRVLNTRRALGVEPAVVQRGLGI